VPYIKAPQWVTEISSAQAGSAAIAKVPATAAMNFAFKLASIAFLPSFIYCRS
jgi:hypothetical protein